MREGEPKPRIIGYEEALAIARADTGGWDRAQVWTLEDYLISRAGDQLPEESRRTFDRRLKEIRDYTIENLTALGNEYRLLADFDLQTESLRVYCGRNNLTLSSEIE